MVRSYILSAYAQNKYVVNSVHNSHTQVIHVMLKDYVKRYSKKMCPG